MIKLSRTTSVYIESGISWNCLKQSSVNEWKQKKKSSVWKKDTQRLCSIGINCFNRKRFRFTQLMFSDRTLFQPLSLETRSFLGVVITRLPFLQPFLSASSIITQLAASRASENNVQRSLPMHFQPFQPSLMRVEKVEQPNQPKTVFCK